MDIQTDIIYITNPDYSAQTISGLTVVIPISEKCPKFNGMIKLLGIGSFLWDVFSKGSTIKKACLEVVEKYDVSMEQANDDIIEFVRNLMKHNLIQKKV